MPRALLMRNAEIRRLLREYPVSAPGIDFASRGASKRPRHLQPVGDCLVQWTAVETYLGVLLAALMRADTNITIALYQFLRRTSARHEAIVKASEYSLDRRGQDLIKALLSHCTSVCSERNHLAHGLFGYVPEVLDGIAWIEQEKVTMIHVDLNKFFLGKGEPSSSRIAKDLRDNTHIYTEKDLLQILERIVTLQWMVQEYRNRILRLRGDPPFCLNSSIFDILTSFAPIWEALGVLHRRERSSTNSWSVVSRA